MIVIDASATVALLLNEDHIFEHSERLFELADEILVAPSHWVAEVGNALVTNVRRGRLSLDNLGYMAEQLFRLDIRLNPAPSFEEVVKIADHATQWGLTYYDAAYVRAAQVEQASLFTLDTKMRTVALQLHIPVLPE